MPSPGDTRLGAATARANSQVEASAVPLNPGTEMIDGASGGARRWATRGGRGTPEARGRSGFLGVISSSTPSFKQGGWGTIERWPPVPDVAHITSAATLVDFVGPGAAVSREGAPSTNALKSEPEAAWPPDIGIDPTNLSCG